MKFEIKILVIAILFLSLGFGNNNVIFAADNINGDGTEITVTSNSTPPSESFLQRTKKNTAIEMQGPTTYSGSGIASPFALGWEDFDDDSGDEGQTPPGNIGGSPIGDATLPMVLSLLLLYFVYRGVTINKRKNL